MRQFIFKRRNKNNSTIGFPKRFYWYLSILTILSISKCGTSQFSNKPTTVSLPTTTSNETADTNSTSNETFISFQEGDHFPRVNFPFGNTGALLFPAIITAYLFLCLTIVCDCFLVPCIQGISTRFEWSLDVAGATIMAAASSSPEMFINILATFLTKSDVGVGTVLGSGLYALLIVPALCILLPSSKFLKVDYWPITRDALAYFISMVTLVIILADNEIHWYEAVSLICVYIIYLIVLIFNHELRYKLESLLIAIHRKRAAGGIIEPLLPLLQKPGRLPVSMSVEDVFYVLEDHTPEFYTMARWPTHRHILAKIEWLLMWPIITILRLTIPTFWNSRFHQLFIITFAMCVAWIGVLCYGISWMMSLIGNKLSMPETVMGLTLIAAGMSIPETISGVIVAKQGYGTMALCNALGSNTFAILICLGVPWLIDILFFQKPYHNYIIINSGGIEYSACIVVTALVVFYIILMANKYRIGTKIGWLLVLLYAIFIGAGVYVELQFFWLEGH